MASVKESVIEMVKELPETTTLEEIMEHLYIKQKIAKCQKQLEEGHYYTHEEAKEILTKWQK